MNKRENGTDPAKPVTAGTILAGNAQGALLTEQQIQQQCLQWLNLQPKTRCWRRNVGAMTGKHNGKSWFVKFGTAGMSDIEGVSNGRHVEIEIKRPGKTPTMVQEAWLDQMSYLGAIAFWCTSLDELERKWRRVIG